MPLSTTQHAACLFGARVGELVIWHSSAASAIVSQTVACQQPICAASFSLQLPVGCARGHASPPQSQKDKHLCALQAYAHATLGRWLQRQGLLQARSCESGSEQEQDPAVRQLHKAHHILAGHPALVHWFGKLALSYGVLLVVLLVSLWSVAAMSQACARGN